MLETLRTFYRSGQTRPVAFRREALTRLENKIVEYQDRIVEALHADLGKSAAESWLTEIALVLGEIRYQRRHLRWWSRPRRVGTPLALFPSRSRIVRDPYGVVLVVAPWNYPFQLLMMPLVGAVAAGNCVVLKPAETTPHVARVLQDLVEEAFEASHVCLVRTNHEGLESLLEEGPDYLFFTGSPGTGSRLMELAARRWIPVTLELGGKSPCIVTEQADVEVAARRIAWAKMLNAGQTCVAPDHVWVQASVKSAFVQAYAKALAFLFRDTAGLSKESPNYARIVTDRHFDRLVGLLSGARVLLGGEYDAPSRFFAPTLVEVSEEHPLMQEEVFGPILPLLEFEDEAVLVNRLQREPKPLALYYFGKTAGGRRFVEQVPSGGACINDAVIHLVNRRLPFGGVGKSGLGSYHGRTSFETFSRERSVLESKRSFDLKLKYPPYKIVKTKWREFLGL